MSVNHIQRRGVAPKNPSRKKLKRTAVITFVEAPGAQARINAAFDLLLNPLLEGERKDERKDEMANRKLREGMVQV